MKIALMLLGAAIMVNCLESKVNDIRMRIRCRRGCKRDSDFDAVYNAAAKDGVFTDVEIQSVFGVDENGLAEFKEYFDVDGDGVVTVEEYETKINSEVNEAK